jgi:hypothetical protein
MKIDRNTQIGGQPAKLVRDLLSDTTNSDGLYADLVDEDDLASDRKAVVSETSFKAALGDWRVWLCALIYFGAAGPDQAGEAARRVRHGLHPSAPGSSRTEGLGRG